MFSIFRDADQLEHVEDELELMLRHCREMFALSSDAVLGLHTAEAVQEELWDLDKALNRTERSIRRELLVHGTVRGAEVDQGLTLAYMSVAKDLERIGDYCKNIWDLAHLGVDLGHDPDTLELKQHIKEVADLLERGSTAFIEEDRDTVHELIPRIQDLEKHFEEHVGRYVRTDEPGHFATPRALLFRHMKRIGSHLSNVLSSVVMPVDRLDFYKKSKAVDAED
jgi:phosphate transport system protein